MKVKEDQRFSGDPMLQAHGAQDFVVHLPEGHLGTISQTKKEKEFFSGTYVLEVKGAANISLNFLSGYVGTISETPEETTRTITDQILCYQASSGVANTITIWPQEDEPRKQHVIYQGANFETPISSADILEIARIPETLRFIEIGSSFGSVSLELVEPSGYYSRDLVELYPGRYVSSSEHEKRFKGVNLEYFRKVLPPDLFKAYEESMGSIEGYGIEPQDRYRGKD